jgi:hypothetical protein
VVSDAFIVQRNGGDPHVRGNCLKLHAFRLFNQRVTTQENTAAQALCDAAAMPNFKKRKFSFETL